MANTADAWNNGGKGYGFIRTDAAGADVFANISEAIRAGEAPAPSADCPAAKLQTHTAPNPQLPYVVSPQSALRPRG
jgi:hypothetical protein